MKSVKTALVLITLKLVGIIKEEIKIVFIIIRYQDFLVEYKVGDFCTRDHSGIVSVWKVVASVEPIVIISFHEDKAEDAKEESKVVQKVIEPQPEPPPIKRWFSPFVNKIILPGRVLRYYGRKKAEESESDISVDSESSEEQARFASTTWNQLFILDIFSVVWSRNGKHSSKGPADKKVSKILFQSVQSSLVECTDLSEPRNDAFHC